MTFTSLKLKNTTNENKIIDSFNNCYVYKLI